MSGVFGYSRTGTEINNNEDLLKVLTSEAPILQILKAETFEVPASTPAGFVSVGQHNQGFYPAFSMMSRSSAYPDYVDIQGYVDDTDVYVYADGSNSITGMYFIHNVDLEDGFVYPNKSGEGDITIQKASFSSLTVSLPNKSVYSRDLRDFSLHSNLRTLQLSALVGNPTDDTYTYDHGLGYAPTFMYFEKFDDATFNNGYAYYTGQQSGHAVYVNDTQVIIYPYEFTGIKKKVLILKDPVTS